MGFWPYHQLSIFLLDMSLDEIVTNLCQLCVQTIIRSTTLLKNFKQAQVNFVDSFKIDWYYCWSIHNFFIKHKFKFVNIAISFFASYDKYNKKINFLIRLTLMTHKSKVYLCEIFIYLQQQWNLFLWSIWLIYTRMNKI